MTSLLNHPSYALFCSLLILTTVLAGGCDEATLGPETTGAVEGTVQDANTNDPIASANVTTSPPTESVLTDENGQFEIAEVPSGDYTITVTKTDYETRSVQVKVQESQATSATILLERGEDFESRTDSLTAEVTNWYNDPINRDGTGPDSIFADVEYSVRNVGDEPVQTYEVYFEIETSDGTFSVEATGDTLDVSQRDIGGFRKYITAEAQAVNIENIYWSTGSD